MSPFSPQQSLETCPRCGHPFPSSEAECPSCLRRRSTSSWPRERVLFATLLVLLLLTIFTTFLSRTFHARERTLASQWFALGDQQLRGGDMKAAIDSFRTSLSYVPDNASCQLKLARALVTLGKSGEARNYLVNVLAQDPGNGEANLELARLARADGSFAAANRYFHNAIYGSWPEDAQNQRLDAWLELSEYLRSRGAAAQAQAELLALAANSPANDPSLHSRLGQLFLETGDPQRALREFQIASPGASSAVAAAGSGLASYELGEYSEAARYLKLALRLGSQDADLAARLATIDQILAANPMQSGISISEKFERTRKAFASASARLNECLIARGEQNPPTSGQAQTGLSLLSSRTQEMQRAVMGLTHHPENIPEVMDLVFDVEKAAAQECGPPAGFDNILLLLSRMHTGVLP